MYSFNLLIKSLGRVPQVCRKTAWAYDELSDEKASVAAERGRNVGDNKTGKFGRVGARYDLKLG